MNRFSLGKKFRIGDRMNNFQKAGQLLDEWGHMYKDDNSSSIPIEVKQALDSGYTHENWKSIETLDVICDYYAKKSKLIVDSLHNYYEEEKKMPNIERERNISLVNESQKYFLDNTALKECPVESTFARFNRDVLKNILEEVDYNKILLKTERNLMLYFRGRNMESKAGVDPLELYIMCWVLDKYVNFSDSKLFTNVGVVTRNSCCPQYINGRDFVSKIKYNPARKIDFKVETSIGANIVHLSHGSPEQIHFGSIPLLGQDILSDKKRRREADISSSPYVSLNISYNDREKKPRHQIDSFNNNEKSSFVSIMENVLRGVKELERVSIENAKKVLDIINV